MLSKSNLEKRAEHYRKLKEDIETGEKTVYVRRCISLPVTLDDFCRTHSEINISALIAKMLYELWAKEEKQKFLESHGDLYEQCKEIIGVDSSPEKRKQTLDILKFYFSARNVNNAVGVKQALDTMEKVNPKVHQAIMEMELYILKHPSYGDKIKNSSGFSEVTDMIKSTVKRWDV